MVKSKKFKFKYKFKPNHLLIFAAILFIGTLIVTQRRDLSKNINLTSIDNNQETVVGEKQRIEISGVKVADFIDKTSQDITPSYYTIAQSSDYHIFFMPADELFFISITSYPFDEHRGIAEQKLLEVLAITEEDACKLNVDITTPAYANPDKAGEVFKLSFCK